MHTTQSSRLVPALLIALTVVLGAVLVGYVALQQYDEQTPSKQKEKRERPKVVKEDPYTPDCEIIREWLRQHEGAVEVVSWGRRTIHQDFNLGGQVLLSARWKRQGETRARSGRFTIGPFNTVESVTMHD